MSKSFSAPNHLCNNYVQMLKNTMYSTCGSKELMQKWVFLITWHVADQGWNQLHVCIYYRCSLEKMKTTFATVTAAQIYDKFSLVSILSSGYHVNKTGCLRIAIRFTIIFNQCNQGDK